MSQTSLTDLKETILSELDVLEDDIHITEDSLTFYLPLNQIERAESVLEAEVNVLEEHEHEYLIRATPQN